MNGSGMRSGRRGLAAVLVALLGAPAVPQQVGEGGFGEFVEVKLVNVEVWVTDKKGVHIKGLTADDFEILEDGKPVQITHFAEVEAGKALPSSITRRLELAEAGEASPQQPATPRIDPSHLVIYFDSLHSLPSGRKRLIQDMRDFLASEIVAPERVLILNQTRNLRTEATFGSTWRELDLALERLARSGSGGDAATAKRLVVRELQDLWQLSESLAGSAPGATRDEVCGYFMPRAVTQVERYIERSRRDVSITLDHMASVASFLIGIPGVKTMLYASDSLQTSPGTDLTAFINNICIGHHDTRLMAVREDLGSAFARLTRHANANRVTIYTLQSTGLAGDFTMGADQAYIEMEGSRAFNFAKRDAERAGMVSLANETGGRAVLNKNDFEVELGVIAREMTSYYSLAYSPTHTTEGGEHGIKVKVLRDGLSVRHRRHYQDKSADTQMAERMQAAIYLGLIENPLEVRLGAGTVEPGGKEKMIVPLHVMLPVDRVVFLPEEEASVARLNVQISTQNSLSGKGVVEKQTFRIVKPPGEEDLLDLLLRLELPEGVHIVAVGVRDEASREASFISTTIELQGAAAGADTG